MAEAHAYQPPFPDPENVGKEQVAPIHQHYTSVPHEEPTASPGPAQPRSARADLSDLSVGEILRRERTRYGKSLEDVEAMLRIRIAYLEAIEQDDHTRLPSRVYAIGFVRSYAEYLGLDGAKIIAIFKRQTSTTTGSGRAPELNFPVAASERRAASPWLFLSATALAAAAIAFWVMSSRPVLPPADEIPPAPPEISTSAINATPPVSAETVARIEPGTGTTEAEIREQVAQIDPSIAVAPIETESPNETQRQAQEITAATTPGTTLETAKEESLAPLSGTETATAAASPHRIVLKAVESTWIEIRDAQGKALLSSILKAGDIYFVPDQPGLVLSTGNAGGFEIELDGKTVGKIGETGDVRRDVALSPSALAGSLTPKTP